MTGSAKKTGARSALSREPTERRGEEAAEQQEQPMIPGIELPQQAGLGSMEVRLDRVPEPFQERELSARRAFRRRGAEPGVQETEPAAIEEAAARHQPGAEDGRPFRARGGRVQDR